MFDVAIIGGDLRQIYIANLFNELSYSVITYELNNNLLTSEVKKANSLKEILNLSNIIITPIPFTRNNVNIFSTSKIPCNLKISDFITNIDSSKFIIGGNFPKNLTDYFKNNNIKYYDIMSDINISILNAIATAEGTILEAIKNSNKNLHQNNCLVIGYGKCAKVLAKKLIGLDANVCISARKEEDLNSALSFGFCSSHIKNLKYDVKNYDFIFNTVPHCILDEEILKEIDKETTIIDIASYPGGIDYDIAKKLNLNAHLCLGLPGKYAPKSSAKILVDAIIKLMSKNN